MQSEVTSRARLPRAGRVPTGLAPPVAAPFACPGGARPRVGPPGGLALFALAVLGACASPDAARLDAPAPRDAATPDSPGQGDAAARDGGGSAGSGGGAGAAGGTAGMGGTGGVEPACEPNPGDEVCPEKCSETCNGRDDDCDLKIDEATDSACAAPMASSACIMGTCRIVSCVSGYRDCNGELDDGCEADAADPDNCGTCGHRCTIVHGTATCVQDQCALAACDAGWADCDSNPADCETDITTLANCGGCGIVCGSVPNAIPTCEPGYCGPGTCDTSFGDCDDTPGNGCEQPLDTLEHCTGCEVGCDFPGSTDDCSSGTCLAALCEAPLYADCDGDPSDGCESLQTATHCGACGRVCDSSLPHVRGASCSSGACAIDCAPGYGDCNQDPDDGCEVRLTSTSHCGACGAPCAFVGGIGDCTSGSCVLASCDPGRGDCDANAGNGCETDTNTDPEHCGGCSAPLCTTANGKPHCQGGQCSAIACTPPMADCSGSGLSCPDNLDNDPNNCGSCGNQCQFGTSTPHATLAGCASSKCSIACDVGYGDCDGNYANGCETPLDTLSDCGACDTACSVPNGVATCENRVCQVQACNVDWGDCTGAPGCETPLNTTSNCGACSAVCNLPGAIETCGGAAGARVCQIAGCEQTYLRDCPPHAALDGCETDVRSSTASCGACGNNCALHPHVSGATCSNSVCQYSCPSGYLACDADPNNGCDTSIRTNTDCSGCGVACERANGTSSCSTGVCQLTGCNPGFGNCDDNDANGCEPLTSLLNCGACGVPCNLANASETCAAGSCEVSACDASWDDCDDDDANGCERNVTQLGPCSPDTNCVKQVYQGRDYFFCQNAVTWSTARTRCQTQLQGGDLVHIDDLAENTFVHANVGGDSWIGGSDSGTEGAWIWANDGAQFWSGASGGSAVGGRFARWASGEPNDLQGQDCARIYKTTGATDGYWDDEGCSRTFRFVCEVRGDLCPDDPLKDVPGQCGCGTPETDDDGDGTANCNDGCPMDPGKVAPGQCGCGTSDADDDGDGTANCDDDCPTDAGKLTPGECGCGQPETDLDGDGTKDCFDGCPYDSAVTSGDCGFDYVVSNVAVGALDFEAAPDAMFDCGTTTLYTAPTAPSGSTCGAVQTHGGHHYLACTDDRSYASAKAQCASVGGSLVSIESAAENDFVRALIGGNGARIGANDLAVEGVWRWSVGDDDSAGPQFWMGGSGGSAVGGLFNAWDSGEPSSSSNDCARMFSDGDWEDVGCSWTGDYVCEFAASVTLTNACGVQPLPVVQVQPGGPQLAVVPLRSLSLASGSTLKVRGARPLALVVLGDVHLAGTLDGRAIGTVPGAGGSDASLCFGSAGADGFNHTSSDTGAGGGGGGAFGTGGGKGGDGDRGAVGGLGGLAAGNDALIPLRGGCGGGRGGIGWIGNAGRWGGAGGGAVQISAAGLLHVAPGAIVSASGGGGIKGTDDEDGGGGGGSGGAVLLEGAVVVTEGGAWLSASGGGAAAGTSSGGSTGNSGTDGLHSSAAAAPGGAGTNGGGKGGDGAAGAAAGSAGANGSSSGLRGSGGGGGGGGQGRIRLNGAFACTTAHSANPPASHGGACP